MIVCLARYKTGSNWQHMIGTVFGGDVTRWIDAWRWFVEHLFFTFYHRICGHSLSFWKPHIPAFRRAFASYVREAPCQEERDMDEDMTKHPTNDFSVDVDEDLWRIWAVIDAMKAKTSRAGAGPKASRHKPVDEATRRRNILSRNPAGDLQRICQSTWIESVDNWSTERARGCRICLFSSRE